ncbi:MAG: Rrf2 family transcriptional regulator [Firmicutes bacterium]|jgi:Rrf2 family protein|nr:Rrf2 family transcriptional regulator [Bacillota bacterium]
MISKKAEYAIAALADLARLNDGEKTTTRSIACRQKIPGNLILQLIASLREAGWVACSRGPGGGVTLIQGPAGISLRQVIELFDGPLGISRCLAEDKPCRDNCSLRGILSEAQGKMLAVLERVTIKDLIASTGQNHCTN